MPADLDSLQATAGCATEVANWAGLGDVEDVVLGMQPPPRLALLNAQIAQVDVPTDTLEGVYANLRPPLRLALLLQPELAPAPANAPVAEFSGLDLLPE